MDAPSPRPAAPPGFPAFLGLCALSSALPLLAPYLPAGPARLASPAAAATLAASLLPAWALLVWPVLARDRSGRAVAAGAAWLLVAGLPFVLGLALAAGVERGRALLSAAVSGAAVLPAGAFLRGPGRAGRGDRVFVAGAVAVGGLLPFVNYALNEFGGTAFGGLYAFSPVLVLRRMLFELPGADPVPVLGLCVAAAAAFLLPRALPGAAATVVLAAAGVAAAAPEIETPLGEAYVPGRLLPLRVRAEGEVEVRLPAGGRLTADSEGGVAEILLPGPPAGAAVVLRTREGEWTVHLPARPLPEGAALLLALGAVPAEFVAAAREAGVHVVRGGEGLPDPAGAALLAADGVIDPEGRLADAEAAALASAGVPVLRSAAPGEWARVRAEAGLLRRPWEEPGRLLLENDVGRAFGPPAPPAGRPGAVFGLLGLFAAAGLAFRWSVRGRPLVALLVLGLAGAGVTAAIAHLCPPRAGVLLDCLTAREGAREVRVFRLTARREAAGRLEGLPNAVALGHGNWRFARSTGTVEVALRRGETRFVVSQRRVGGPAPAGPWDLLVRGGRLLLPDGQPFPEGRLRTPAGRPDERVQRIRKFLRLADPPPGAFGVLLPAGRREVGIARLP